MRIAVLADIHSNEEALEAVLADAAAQDADAYIVAGDLVSDGPSPRGVLNRVRSLTQYVIKGNREDYMMRYHNSELLHWEGCKQVASLLWTYRQMEGGDLGYIAGLPEQLSIPLDDKMSLRVVHGSPFSMYELLKPDKDMAPVERAAGAIPEHALVFGHNHMQWTGMVCGKLLMDPGAVGVPFNGGAKAEYGILTYAGGELSAELRLVPYDFPELEKKLEASGLAADAPVWTKITFEGVKAGRNYCIEFLNEARQAMKDEGVAEGMIPNEIWDRVAQNWWHEMDWGTPG